MKLRRDYNLAFSNPEIAKQWHPRKNGKLSPSDVTPGSNKKACWICDKGHEWESTVYNRTTGSNCPYCSSHRVSKDNNLEFLNPKLAKEWHPIKNGDLRPFNLTPSSNKKVWWKCNKGHEWKAVISSRNSGHGCPFCAGLYPTKENNLHVVNPKLSKEWHPIKNGKLNPKDVTYGSGKKVWWKCSKGHEWRARIVDRKKGQNCPFCSGHRVSKDNNLEVLNPKLAKEWHSIKNGNLTPKDVTPGSGKKVWWICDKGHEWIASVDNRNKGRGCPYCKGKKISSDNNLEVLNPKLAKEWHPTKNGNLTPNRVTPGSRNKVWWQCKKEHEWEAVISSRNQGSGCPYCIGLYPTKNHNLYIENPTLAREWHPTKNGNLSPVDVLPHSGKKVWWLCKRGHEWKTSINNRSNGRGCPFCNSSTSVIELRILTELKYFFKNIKHREKVYGKECDIFLPDLNFAIEVDSFYWHKDKLKHDISKHHFLKEKKIKLLNLRENNLKPLSNNDIFYSSKKNDFELINEIILFMFKKIPISDDIKIKLKVYIKKGKLKNEREFFKLLEMLPSPFPGLSLYNKNKAVSKEWHPTKNGNLTPRDVFPNSGLKVWWICDKGHEWQAIIQNRNKGISCPYCSGKRASKEYNIEVLFPKLAKEWNPIKNGNFSPNDFVPYSNKKVWWLCKRGHEWKATIANRSNGTGCPYCSGRFASIEYNLEVIYPKLSKEWHSTKNENLTPKDVTPSSNKKAWWICYKGHEWKASINDRSSGNGCPFCSGKKVSHDNNLEIVNLILAKEWHPTKNGDLRPFNVTPSSNRKVWWICDKGHEWMAIISSRNRGTGCPYCSGKRASKEYNLEVLFPKLAKEWHPTKNGDLTPDNVTPGSHKKVWWMCEHGHEWPTKIYNRYNGSGCPYCYKQNKEKV